MKDSRRCIQCREIHSRCSELIREDNWRVGTQTRRQFHHVLTPVHLYVPSHDLHRPTKSAVCLQFAIRAVRNVLFVRKQFFAGTSCRQRHVFHLCCQGVYVRVGACWRVHVPFVFECLVVCASVWSRMLRRMRSCVSVCTSAVSVCVRVPLGTSVWV